MSILQEIDLKSGIQAVVQVNGSFNGSQRVALSFDGAHQNTTIWMSVHELKAYAAIITTALHEAAAEAQKMVDEASQNG